MQVASRAAFAAAVLVCHPALAQDELVDAGAEVTDEENTETAANADRFSELEQRIAELEQQVTTLTEHKEEDELQQLIAEAEAEAKAPEDETRPEEREFLWGALALQKLNPEISVSGDFVAGMIFDEHGRFYAGADDRSMMLIRELGLHIQHVLDPYSMFKAALHFAPEPHPVAHLEELYITWFGVVPSISITVGRFRQNFGVVNRWHEHDLDQVAHPLAMQLVLGHEGLNQTGLGIKWFMPPLIASANELTIEVTNGENEILFAGEFVSVPAVLGHLKNYYDLSDSTYLELGLSGMWGMNNQRGYPAYGDLSDEPWRQTVLAGADLTIRWSPPQRAKYRSFTWRSEGYFVHKQTPDDPESIAAGLAEADSERIAWGAYSYIDYQLSARWFAGVRGDVAVPTVRTRDELAWDVVPYITVWQSEFVYLRLEYRHGQNLPYERPDGSLGLRTDNRVMLQVDWAAGPHKHEKY